MKHSNLIRQDVNTMLKLKREYARLDSKTLNNMIHNKCSFLYTNYTHIFNKLLKDRLDINLFNRFLNILEKIETGDYDQHDGSYKVGELLKKIYIDSALKESEQNDKKYNKKTLKEKKISWSEYKKMNS